MANKKISELQSRTPSLTDLMLVGDPSSGYSYKCTVSALATIIETDIADGYVTISTTQTISGAKTFSNNLALTSVANANTDTDKFLVLNASNIVNFRTGAEVLSDIGGQGALTLTTTGTSGAATLVSNVLNIPQYQGVISLASIGSSPNANGATLSSNTLTLQPASGSFGGVVTTGFQEFAGQKRFIGNPIQFDKHLEVKNIDSWGVSWGYTSLASKDTPVFGFLRGHSFVGTVTYYAWFTYGSTGERNYTLPSTDGTLALTSDITSSISGTTNYIPKFTGSSSIGNSVIYESSSNIGIGTTAPSTKLHVLASDGLNEGLAATIIRQGGSAGNNGILVDVTNTVGQYVADFRIANSSVMRLDASGNLGLGVTPSAWGSAWRSVDISSETSIAGASGNSRIYHNAFSGVSADIYKANGGASFYGQTGGLHSWYTAPSGTAGNAISFTQAMTLFSTGNLSVGGTVDAGARLGVTGVTLGNNNGGNVYAINSSGANYGFILNNSANTFSLGYGASLSTVGTSVLTWNSSGNVGIGTTSPTSISNYIALTINGTSGSFTEYQENGGRAFRIGSDGATGGFISQTTADPIRIFTNATERMRITSSGEVLIGTTSTTAKLTVRDDGNTFSTHISGNSQTNGIAIGTLSTNNAAIQGYTRTFSATNNIVLQPDGGEVYIAGITDQGAYNLQVNGTGVWGAGAYVNGSDRSLKENIYDLDGCLELVKQLKPVTYKYKESYSKDTSTQTGFIAQDLKELFKDKSYLNGLVKEGGQHLSVAYQNLIPVLAKAIQELEAEIEILKNK